MRRQRIDGGTVIAALIAALTVLLTLLALGRLQPASHVLGSPTTAALSAGLETPLRPPSSTTSSWVPPLPPASTVTTTPPATVGPGEVFYADCPQARAAGVTDLRRGGPGYRAQLDRDNDGRACESPPVPPTTTPPPRPTWRPTSSPTAPPPRTTTARTTTTTSPPPFIVVTPEPTLSITTAPPPLLTVPPTEPPTSAPPSTTTTEPPTTTTAGPRFTDCNQVAAAGIDLPLLPTSPWWNPALDVDGDGQACEDDSPTPPPTTTTTTITPPVDCVAAWDLGLAPIPMSSPYYRPEWDQDGRGVACAVDPRALVDAASTSSTTTTTSTTTTGPPEGNGR